MDETKKDEEMKVEPQTQESQAPAEEPKKSAFEKLKSNAHEGDDASSATLTFRQILGGDILSAQMVRSQVWLLLLIVMFIVVSVAFRYQCQQDSIRIVQLEEQLVDAKYKALNSSSKLTEQTRESRILERLKQLKDSTLHISTQPPFIVVVEEK